jgi:pimeloyl-ACP methyl ester carboxylesterase
VTVPAKPVTVLPMPSAPGVEHGYRVVDGVRIHYAEAGEGKPLVLLHGWPQHWWSWRELIEPLALAGHRVICPDIRGMGWSDAPRTGYDLRRLSADLFGLLDALGLERVQLVGHDWGFLIGYAAAFARPDRIERFVPIGGVTPWSGIGAPPSLYARPWHVYLLATPAGPRATHALARNRLRAWRSAGRFTEEELAIYTAPLRRPLGHEATVGRDRQIVRRDIPWFLRHARSLRLRVPTLHLNGEHDPLTQGVPHSYRRFADDMRLELVPDSGHFVAEERPQWLLERLAAFLARP